MYSLFKDKEGVFKDALDNYYLKLALTNILLLKNNYGKKGIEKFLEKFIFNENFKGCLFTNTLRQSENIREDSLEIVKDFFSKLEMQIEKNLKEESELGNFNGDPRSMALTIITLIHGLNVHGKYNHSKEDGELIKKNILSLIK